MSYRRCGHSGVKLPAISLGLWHNFGSITPFVIQQSILRTAFDCGITHFDLANNYGPPYGEAERNFGMHMERDWKPHRDELFISTKAGYDMWEGPYGNFGSRKYLISSIDQSLKRMHVDYVDVFYHHRPDPETPIEETMGALDQIVRSGNALYVGISNYDAEQTREAVRVLKELGTPCLIHQPSYSLLNRRIENNGVLATLRAENVAASASRRSPTAAHRQIPARHSGRLPRRARPALSEGGQHHAGAASEDCPTQRNRHSPRPKPDADGAVVGAA